MGTKARQLQRKLAARKQEQHQREARARAVRANLRGMAADLNELQEIQRVPLTPETMAELHELGIDPQVVADMHAAGMTWNPLTESFEGAWEAA